MIPSIGNVGPTLTTVLGGFIAVVGAFLKSEHDVRSKTDATAKHTRKPAIVILFGGLLSIAGGLWSGQNQTKSAELRAQFEHDLRAKSDEIAQKSEDLVKLNREIATKSDQISSLNQEIAASVTGGNEFVYLDPLLAEEQNRIFLIIVHDGRYPIYDVGFRVLDFRVGGTKPLAEEMLSNTFSVGSLAPKTRRFVAYWPLVPGQTHYAFNFFFTARNARGFTIQQYRFAKINGKWLSATDVRPYNGGRVLHSHIDPNYPKRADGKIDWNSQLYSNP